MDISNQAMLQDDMSLGAISANEVLLGNDSALPSVNSLVFIDPAVDQYQQLIDEVSSNTQVYILDGNSDGIGQISEILSGYTDIADIQVFSHAGEGNLQLGTSQLTVDSLNQYHDQLTGWGLSLTQNADILLFGCDLAASESGEALIQSLSQITGADISASNDLTGSELLGGDWELEYSTGTIEAEIALNQQSLSNFDGVLSTLVTANRIAGSLTLFEDDGAGNFGSGTNIASGGSRPSAVAFGDINQDGFEDIIIANRGSNNISLFLNDGSGSLLPAQTFAVGGSRPADLVVNDVNADGYLDAITVNGSGTLSILLGDTNGSFEDPMVTPLGAQSAPESVTTADVNLDGNLDFLVANRRPNSVSVLLGDGAGGVGAITTYAVGLNPESIVAGDFNNDGWIDFATGNARSSTVSVSFGDGTGSFAAATDYTTGGAGSGAVAVGDLNEDNFLDIVVANANSNSVSVLLNAGDGSFESPITYGVGTQPADVLVADVNGDANLDIVTANFGSNGVSILSGNGSGSFALEDTLTTQNEPIAIAFGNLASNTPPPADTTAPILQNAVVDGATLTLTYNEALDGASDPVGNDYTITVNGISTTVSAVDANGSTVTLTLDSAISNSDTVTLDYTPGTTPVQDAAGNDAIALSGINVTNNTPAPPPTDTTAPILQNAVVDGATLTLTYNEALDGASDPVGNDYTITVNGISTTVSTVDANGSTVTLTLDNAISNGDTVTLNYTPGTTPVQDAAGNDAIALSGINVTNNTAATGSGSSLENFTLTYDLLTIRDAFDFTAFGYTYDQGYYNNFDVLPDEASNTTSLTTRRNIADMTQTEIDAFINAVLTLKNTMVVTDNGIEISIYDQFVAVHVAAADAIGRLALNGETQVNPGHGDDSFLPWHRALLAEFEKALQLVDPNVFVPYWDWTDADETWNEVFIDEVMGPNGGGGNGGVVQTGHFSTNNGWEVREDLVSAQWSGVSANTTALTRNMGRNGMQIPGSTNNIDAMLGRDDYDRFRAQVERARGGHNNAHFFIGGMMSNVGGAPADPMFWLLHANVDRLWAEWQLDGHWDDYAPDGQPYGHDVDDLMFLWDDGTFQIADDLRDLLPSKPGQGNSTVVNGNTTVANDLQNDGVVNPGNSPGIIKVHGDYVQTSEGELTIEITGKKPISEFDVLKIKGTAYLDGTLNIYFLDNVEPELGIYKFLKASDIEGDFTTINIYGLQNAYDYQLHQHNGAYILKLCGLEEESEAGHGIAHTPEDLQEIDNSSLYNPRFGAGIDMYGYGLTPHHGWGEEALNSDGHNHTSDTNWFLPFDVDINYWLDAIAAGEEIPDEFLPPMEDHHGEHGNGGMGSGDDMNHGNHGDGGMDHGMGSGDDMNHGNHGDGGMDHGMGSGDDMNHGNHGEGSLFEEISYQSHTRNRPSRPQIRRYRSRYGDSDIFGLPNRLVGIDFSSFSSSNAGHQLQQLRSRKRRNHFLHKTPIIDTQLHHKWHNCLIEPFNYE